jgi:hypothetical protein
MQYRWEWRCWTGIARRCCFQDRRFVKRQSSAAWTRGAGRGKWASPKTLMEYQEGNKAKPLAALSLRPNRTAGMPRVGAHG